MAFDFRSFKEKMKPVFFRDYEKYYPVESLRSVGFERGVCENCGRGFWSSQNRKFCDEPACSGGYRFIGKKAAKNLGYKKAWDEYVSTFEKWGYVPIKRYPVVCRWYEDLYFVGAGINIFQPYVVSGQVEPPAPAVLEPQFCLRFQDIDSVGLTGRHYTGFIMAGQHTFNTPKHHTYFKDEGILQMHEFLTCGMGIDPGHLVYHEDVWAGGGNFGPSMEFFSHGLELGNQVYMQYEVAPDGSTRELSTKVIDMGAGLERWAWFCGGTPMSYDSTFPKAMNVIYRAWGERPDEGFIKCFSHYAGLLDVDDTDDIGGVWQMISKNLSMPVSELRKKAYEMRALYAIADHTRSVLVAIHDGALPSNVGGGYNLRNILRRCWSLCDQYGIDLDLARVFEAHIGEFGGWYTELGETGSLFDIIEVERRRYRDGLTKGKRLLSNEPGMSIERMVELYDSHGISPHDVSCAFGVDIPDDFYRLVQKRHERREEDCQKPKRDAKKVEGLADTKPLYYEGCCRGEYDAKVVAIEPAGPLEIVVDRTCFYPEGGGQEADLGTMGGVDVIHVERLGGVILHMLKDCPEARRLFESLSIGDTIKCRVDEKRRTQLMQHHSATHIVNACARKVLGPHIWQAGAHKSESASRLDITHYKSVFDSELENIEERANAIVEAGLPVRVSWMRRNEAELKHGMRLYQGGAVPGTRIRVVEIHGVDAEACGGTHVSNTLEVGRIKMLSARRIQDGVVRLEFTAGGATEKESERERLTYIRCLRAASAFGVKDEIPNDTDVKKELEDAKRNLKLQDIRQIPDTLSKFAKEIGSRQKMEQKPLGLLAGDIFGLWKDSKKSESRDGHAKASRLEEKIFEMIKKGKTATAVCEGVPVKELTRIAKAAKDSNGIAVIVNRSGDKANIAVGSAFGDAKEICENICKKAGGGCGGSKDLSIGGGDFEIAKRLLKDL